VGECAAFLIGAYGVPTRYRKVVLTLSKFDTAIPTQEITT